MASNLPRLPRSRETKAKISAALKGRPRPQAVRDAISKALTGRKHTEEAKAKMRAVREAWDALSPEEQKLRRSNDLSRRRHQQWRKDKYAAARMGDMALLDDVKQSNGWKWRRKIFDPTGVVSDGIA